nr:proline-rich domain-containing protein [Schaalia odontolytica]
MSTPNYGGQPGPNGQFQGQVPQPGTYNPQYQGQVPQPGAYNPQYQGQAPQQGAKKSRGKMAAIISVIVVAVLVVIGGGAFALTRFLPGAGGFATPNALANSISSAFDSNKLANLAPALAPSELEAATLWQKDYKANGKADWTKLMSPEALADYIGQIDISKSAIEHTVDEKSDNLSLITITKWEGEITVKPELADKFREYYEKAKGDKLTADESKMFDDLKREISEEPNYSGNILQGLFNTDKLTLVSVKEGGKWYISPVMTMAEQMVSYSSVTPNYGADFTNVEGAKSPEEAVSGMVDALRNGAGMGDKDFYRFLDLPERRVAAVYGGSGSTGGVGDSIQVNWGLTSTKVSGGAVVNFGTTSITFDGSYKVEFNNDTVTYSYADSGSSYNSRYTSSKPQSQTVRFTEGLVNPERLGVFAVQDNTGWHVSFISTVGNLNLLEATDAAVNEAVNGMSSSFGSGSSVSTNELRDMATTNKPVGAMLVIVWNFMKSSN